METDPIPGSRRKSGNPTQPFPNLQPTKVMIKIPIRKFQFKLLQKMSLKLHFILLVGITFCAKASAGDICTLAAYGMTYCRNVA